VAGGELDQAGGVLLLELPRREYRGE